MIHFCFCSVILAITLIAHSVECRSLQPQDGDEPIYLPHSGHDFVHFEFARNATNKAPNYAEFKYRWLSSNGDIFDNPGAGRLEVAATIAVSETAFSTGISYVRGMTQHMPPELFAQLARDGSVGLFTAADKTTIFPEYEHLRDRPECAGTCAGWCSDTCTGDGRKWDSLAGVGGVRATCLDDNFMCTNADPYYRQYNVLVHEFGHTIHMYGIPSSSGYVQRITEAWANARARGIWENNSYAMSNYFEYFAEGTTVFFNTSRHPNSSGGMNGCGRPSGSFCASETEARNWLLEKDPMLFDALSYSFTNYRPSILAGLSVCP